ncbi:hypothetical protein ADUPG1_003119, partial [Aduncisulcus paluster]
MKDRGLLSEQRELQLYRKEIVSEVTFAESEGHKPGECDKHDVEPEKGRSGEYTPKHLGEGWGIDRSLNFKRGSGDYRRGGPHRGFRGRDGARRDPHLRDGYRSDDRRGREEYLRGGYAHLPPGKGAMNLKDLKTERSANWQPLEQVQCVRCGEFGHFAKWCTGVPLPPDEQAKLRQKIRERSKDTGRVYLDVLSECDRGELTLCWVGWGINSGEHPIEVETRDWYRRAYQIAVRRRNDEY